MPELPEVETTRRGLAKALLGAKISEVEQRAVALRSPIPRNLPQRLQGRTIKAISCRAKYILIELDNDDILLIHLGMSGRMVLAVEDGAPPQKHDHLIFHFAGAKTPRLTFNDPRRFGVCDLFTRKEMEKHKLLRTLGIEPLGEELTAEKIAELMRGKKTSIKTALLDQRLIAGLGNIYVCEALFYAGIRPERLAGSLTKAEIARLVPAIVKVLNAAVKAGGSSLRDYVQTDGQLGYFQHQFAVYDKEGQACPDCTCKPQKTGGVQRIVQSGRSSYFCATKQK